MASPVPTIRMPLPGADSGDSRSGFPADALLARAEILGIPWRRILRQEIEAEEKLRTYVPDLPSECPLESAVEILGIEAARSWRVRDRIETLAYQARASVRGAERRLRGILRVLAGGSRPDGAAVRRHCRLAYQRILLLQRARRAAARSRGTAAERLAFICMSARCKFEDAQWALGLLEAGSTRRGWRMEAAVRKVRDEGFFVPRAATEARSLSQLRRIVFASAGSGFRDVVSSVRRAGAS
jgi:hypothetical protein